MRIDSHMHGMHADRDPQTGRLVPPLRPIWDPAAGVTPEAYIAASREHGTERILLLDPPQVAFPLLDIFGDFVLAAPMVDIDAITVAQLEDYLDRGAVGIKFIGPMHPYGDNRYFPLYQALLDRNALAVFHTGYLANAMFVPDGVMGRTDYIDITYMRPATLDRIARAFPELKILMAHFGNPWWEEAWKIMASNTNIYADLSGGTAYRRALDMWAQIFAPDGQLDTASFGKLCFGTDGQAFVPGLHDQKIGAFYDRLYDRLNVPTELREQVDRGNMLTLTGADAAPPTPTP